MIPKKIVVGFDGFLDILAKPIAEKRNDGNRYFATIDAFGKYLCGQAGKSCSIELDVTARKPGGNAPLLSIAAAALGMDVNCVGMMGWPKPDALFAAMPFQTYTYLPPGESTALEFDDGKVFLAPSIPFLDDPWAKVDAAMQNRADEVFAQADIVALVNWSEIPFAHALWEAALAALLPYAADKEKHMLFDLCDCSRKLPADIEAVLKLIGRFSARRHSILSLNENECLNIGAKLFDESDCTTIATNIHKHFNVDEVVVHALKWSLVVNHQEQCCQQTIFVKKPVVSTGAGDNFNAAYAYGAAMKTTAKERLAFCHRFVHTYITSGKSGLPLSQHTVE